MARKLSIKVYSDGAVLETMLKDLNSGLVSGFTTNPSLMKKAGITSYIGFAKEVLKDIKEFHVSFEVFADDIETMEKEAEKIIAEKRQKIEEIKKMAKDEQKGLFILAPTPMRVFGKGTLPNDIMEMLKIKNIAAGMEGMSPTLTPEYIIKENPDIILTFVKNPQEIVKANPQIKDINAIKNGKFVVLETGQILRGSPRMIDYIADVYQKTK